MDKQQLAAQLQTDRAALVQQLSSLQGVLLGHGYVVRCQGLTLAFDVNQVTKVASAPRTCPLRSAPRYTKQDAETLAAAVKNGNGARGQAVHIVDALKEAIAELDNLLAQLA